MVLQEKKTTIYSPHFVSFSLVINHQYINTKFNETLNCSPKKHTCYIVIKESLNLEMSEM